MLQRISIRQIVLGLGLLMACGLPALGAQAPGDFAPRGSLLYIRANDVSACLEGLLGQHWKKHTEQLLDLIDEREIREIRGSIDEAKRFVDYLGETEVVLIDVMVRAPNMQVIEIVRLKQGAPKTFSEAFVKAITDRHDRDLKAGEDFMSYKDTKVRLTDGMLITTVGGTAERHVADVLEGRTGESLSRVEKFKKWNEGARGDIVAWADLGAWRNALDRLGEERRFLDDDARMVLSFLEWEKWETFDASITLPIDSGGVQIRANLTTSEPLQKPYVFFRPSGSTRLAGMLPAETLAFASVQLGTDHEKTYNDIFSTFHDVAQQYEPEILRLRIQGYEDSVKRYEEAIEQLKKDEDKEKSTEAIKEYEGYIKAFKEMIAKAHQELAAYKVRPFNPNNETGSRQGRSEAEEFHDELNHILKQFGFTRGEIARALGSEGVVGIIDLPDPSPDADDPGYWEDHWFFAVETTTEFDAAKNKLLDMLLARNLPADMPERERERAMKQANELACYPVTGGEILCERRLRQEVVFFAGSGIAGAAANEIVARRMLEAAQGRGRFDTGKLGGGTMGSKLGWIDLRATIDRIMQGHGNRRGASLRFPEMMLDLRSAFGGGAYLSAQTDERLNGLSLKVTFSGTRDFSGLLPMIRDEVMDEHRADHDESELRALGQGLRSWKNKHAQQLEGLGVDDRRALLKTATPEELLEKGFYTPRDGLRSAFDPELAKLTANSTDDKPFGKEAADLSESSFIYYGLYAGTWPTEEPGGTRGDFGYSVRTRMALNGWIVAAMREPWARGGRYVLIEDRRSFETRWMSERDFDLLLTANAENRTSVPAFERDLPNQPEWKRRKRLARSEWVMRSIQQALTDKAAQAAAQGETFQPSFDRGTEEQLRELLGSTRERPMDIDVRNLKIWTTEDGIYIRMTDGDIWGQYGPKGSAASWMPEAG